MSQFTNTKELNHTASAPLVSIISPVRNGIKYLEICLQSVLNQTYPNIEQIFVDGGSTDGTLEMLASYQAKYPERIRFITGTARGVGHAVNQGYKASKGAIIGWLDADDLYEPDAIQTAVDFFRENADAYFVYGRCNMINEKGEVIACFISRDFDIRESLNYWHYIHFAASFYKREVIERVGYLNNLGNDLDFFIRVHKRFKMHRIENTLANWRLHGTSITLSPGAREKRIVRERLRQDFFLSLKYGGSIFAPRSQRYRPPLLAFAFSMVEGLRPVFGRTYPLLKRILARGLYD